MNSIYNLSAASIGTSNGHVLISADIKWQRKADQASRFVKVIHQIIVLKVRDIVVVPFIRQESG